MPKTKTLNKTASPFKGVKIKTSSEYFPKSNFVNRANTINIASDVPRLGLCKGDQVNIEPVTELDENSIYIWDIPERDSYTIGETYWNFGDFYIGKHKQDQYAVACLGKVVSVVRSYDASKYISVVEPEPLETEEITVTCEDCGKTISGRPDFLKGMYWKIKKDSAECPACR